jgi:hypothetical protein
MKSSSSHTLDALTFAGRLRGTKRLWLFVTVWLAGLAVLAAQAVAVRRELASNDLGFDIQRTGSRDAFIGSVAPRWSELHPGDRLVSMGGHPIGADAFNIERCFVERGPLTVEVVRDGATLQVTGTVDPPNLRLQLTAVLRWIAGLLLWLIATGVFLLRPGVLVSWLFFLFLLAIMPLVAVTASFPAPASRVFPLLFSLFGFGGSLGVHLFSVFPRVRGLRRAALPLHGVAFALAFTRMGLWWTHDDAGQRFVAFDVASRVFAALSALTCIFLFGQNWYQARKSKDEVLASTSRMLLVGALIGLVAPLVVNSLVRALHLDGSLAHQASTAFALVFGVLTAIALVRHNPLEIDRYAASVVGYVVTIGGLGSVFVLGLATIPFAVRGLGLANSTEALMALTAVTFFSVSPSFRYLRRAIDRWFSRFHTDSLQTAELFGRVSESVRNEPREVALQTAVDAAKVIGPELVALWQLDATGQQLVRQAFRGGPAEHAPVPRSGPIQQALERAGGVAGLAPTSLPVDAQEALWKLGLAMSVPVRAHGVAIGFLGVGRRGSGFGYRAEDQTFLHTLCEQVGLLLERGEVVRQVGRYRIERRLAAGGMAEVFLAWQLGPGGFERKVALKRLLPELAEDPKASAILLDEARITSRLTHPNIAHVYEVGIEGGQPFIAMEFIDGPPLRGLIAAMTKAAAPTPLPIALAIAKGLLSALNHAHELKDQQGAPLHVVHRDVTPANVLVSTAGEMKLVDFGLVHATTRLYRTQTGVARGTLPYMSPEQSHHADLDRRSDVYSAGATLYELFTQARPYPQGPTSQKPVAASTLTSLPRAVDGVFEQAVAAEVNARYATAELFWRALEEACAPVKAATDAEVAAWVRSHSAAWSAPRAAAPAKKVAGPTEETATVATPRPPAA